MQIGCGMGNIIFVASIEIYGDHIKIIEECHQRFTNIKNEIQAIPSEIEPCLAKVLSRDEKKKMHRIDILRSATHKLWFHVYYENREYVSYSYFNPFISCILV